MLFLLMRTIIMSTVALKFIIILGAKYMVLSMRQFFAHLNILKIIYPITTSFHKTYSLINNQNKMLICKKLQQIKT